MTAYDAFSCDTETDLTEREFLEKHHRALRELDKSPAKDNYQHVLNSYAAHKDGYNSQDLSQAYDAFQQAWLKSLKAQGLDFDDLDAARMKGWI